MHLLQHGRGKGARVRVEFSKLRAFLFLCLRCLRSRCADRTPRCSSLGASPPPGPATWCSRPSLVEAPRFETLVRLEGLELVPVRTGSQLLAAWMLSAPESFVTFASSSSIVCLAMSSSFFDADPAVAVDLILLPRH